MTALILVDVQNDFMPGGALPVPYGNEIVPIIQQLIPHFERVIGTQDWHPAKHVSFGPHLWPIHCVQGTPGADFAAKIDMQAVFRKGVDPLVDSYSAFFDEAHRRSTGLEAYLREHRLDTLFFSGLATDFCVLYSVLDALDLGFKVTLIKDACRAIHDEAGALEKMRKKGAKIVFSKEIC